MNTTDLILALNLVPIVKGSIVVIQATYLIYAFLLTRQVKLLNQSFSTPYKNFFKLGAFIHLLATLIILIATILFF